MPIVPNTIERFLTFQLNQAPGLLLYIYNAVAFRVVLAAVRLKVFDTLQKGSLSLEQLSATSLMPMIQAISRPLGISYFQLINGQVYA